MHPPTPDLSLSNLQTIKVNAVICSQLCSAAASHSHPLCVYSLPLHLHSAPSPADGVDVVIRILRRLCMLGGEPNPPKPPPPPPPAPAADAAASAADEQAAGEAAAAAAPAEAAAGQAAAVAGGGEAMETDAAGARPASDAMEVEGQPGEAAQQAQQAQQDAAATEGAAPAAGEAAAAEPGEQPAAGAAGAAAGQQEQQQQQPEEEEEEEAVPEDPEDEGYLVEGVTYTGEQGGRCCIFLLLGGAKLKQMCPVDVRRDALELGCRPHATWPMQLACPLCPAPPCPCPAARMLETMLTSAETARWAAAAGFRGVVVPSIVQHLVLFVGPSGMVLPTTPFALGCFHAVSLTQFHTAFLLRCSAGCLWSGAAWSCCSRCTACRACRPPLAQPTPATGEWAGVAALSDLCP